MRRPASHAAAGEQRGKQLLRDAHHGVDEARVHVHVGTHVLTGALFAQDHLGRQALDALQEIELGLVLGSLGEPFRKALANHRARIALRVDRVSHAVHQARFIVGLLVHDARQEGGNFIVVFPILDIFLHLSLHGEHLVVGAAVAVSLERPDGGRVGGVRIGVG